MGVPRVSRRLRVPPIPIVLRLATVISLAGLFPTSASAQELSDGGAQIPRSSAASALGSELHRYVVDGRAILLAPLHWDTRDWTTAAIGIASVAFLTQEDARIDAAITRNRSSQTNAVSRAVTPFGSYAAIGVSVAPLAAGWIFKNAELRDTGCDAIEAEIFAAGIVTPLLKKTVGRLRPAQGSDADELAPLSSGQSFPSGHATEAFAVASVLAARSKGWVVPVVAYTLATGVGLARMNDRAHFSSDVVAGALIGTAIGHAVVNRHSSSDAASSWSVVPVGSMARSRPGYGLAISFGEP